MTPPAIVRDALAAAARAAYPDECCGYLVGDALVPCRNAAADPRSGFEIAGAELFAFARALGSAAPPTAIYHSHTNGRAYFSARDAASATTADGPAYPVDHLVVGVTATGETQGARFAWSAAAAAYVEVARW